ncbi:SAM-dependent methyltransferase [Nocardia grenadensis]|uniref:SAM-dependent methyltransferase n=1 Tax=Nocardia grenadensis TaxID=931537 RepID=UPI003D762B04
MRIAAGSFVVMSRFRAAVECESALESRRQLPSSSLGRFRTSEDIASYFEGLELLEPGVVDVERRRLVDRWWGSVAGGVVASGRRRPAKCWIRWSRRSVAIASESRGTAGVSRITAGSSSHCNRSHVHR